MTTTATQTQQRGPRPTTGTGRVTVSGYSDEGGWHRAIQVAGWLYDQNLWDGINQLTIKNPYQVHTNLFGFRELAPVLGTDYTIANQPEPALSKEEPVIVEPAAEVIADDESELPHPVLVAGDTVRHPRTGRTGTLNFVGRKYASYTTADGIKYRALVANLIPADEAEEDDSLLGLVEPRTNDVVRFPNGTLGLVLAEGPNPYGISNQPALYIVDWNQKTTAPSWLGLDYNLDWWPPMGLEVVVSEAADSFKAGVLQVGVLAEVLAQSTKTALTA